jgi:site-specific DNA-methyltransferase (adenine-specific)
MSIKIKTGNCLEVLKTMPEQSVNTCVTSPPYWGLRDYGESDQLGLEETPEEYVENMVAVFREVKRVLRDDGTVWLNLGDSYAGPKGNNRGEGAGGGQGRGKLLGFDNIKTKVPNGLKQKDLVGIPWRVAFALQADGWYLRQDIIWHKPNPMPESVKDRCTKAHEYIFLLSKNAKYYCDMDLIREPVKKSNKGFIMARARTASGALGGENKHNMERRDYREIKGANKRSVWTVTTKPFKGAHFATFPPDLIEPCVLAGCPENGTVLDPFGGAGTTGLVAQQHNRNAVLIELNPEYAEMAKNRIYNDAPLFSSVKLIKPNENKGFRQNDH